MKKEKLLTSLEVSSEIHETLLKIVTAQIKEHYTKEDNYHVNMIKYYLEKAAKLAQEIIDQEKPKGLDLAKEDAILEKKLDEIQCYIEGLSC